MPGNPLKTTTEFKGELDSLIGQNESNRRSPKNALSQVWKAWREQLKVQEAQFHVEQNARYISVPEVVIEPERPAPSSTFEIEETRIEAVSAVVDTEVPYKGRFSQAKDNETIEGSESLRKILAETKEAFNLLRSKSARLIDRSDTSIVEDAASDTEEPDRKEHFEKMDQILDEWMKQTKIDHATMQLKKEESLLNSEEEAMEIDDNYEVSALDPYIRRITKALSGLKGVKGDVDEIVHVFGVILTNVFKLAKGGPEEVRKEFIETAHLLATDAVGFMAKEVLPHGRAENIIALSGDALVTIFALIAINAGIGEGRGARADVKVLNERIEAMEPIVQSLEVIAEKVKNAKLRGLTTTQPTEAEIDQADDGIDQEREKLFKSIEYFAHLHKIQTDDQLERLKFLKEQIKYHGYVGDATVVAGVTVGIKVLIDMTVKAYGMNNEITDRLLAASRIVGPLSTLGAAPATALGVLALGGFALHKIKAQKKMFDESAALMETQHTWQAASNREDFFSDDATIKHRENLHEDFEEQRKFLASYKRGMTAFTIGGSAYTTMIAFTMSQVISSMRGSGGWLDNLATLPVQLGGTIASAIPLAYGSFSFFKGHPKQEEYHHELHLDHPHIDRNFFAALNLLPIMDPENVNPLIGLQARAQLTAQNDTFESLRINFLEGIAAKNQLNFVSEDPLIHVEKSDEIAATEAKIRKVIKSDIGRLSRECDDLDLKVSRLTPLPLHADATQLAALQKRQNIAKRQLANLKRDEKFFEAGDINSLNPRGEIYRLYTKPDILEIRVRTEKKQRSEGYLTQLPLAEDLQASPLETIELIKKMNDTLKKSFEQKIENKLFFHSKLANVTDDELPQLVSALSGQPLAGPNSNELEHNDVRNLASILVETKDELQKDQLALSELYKIEKKLNDLTIQISTAKKIPGTPIRFDKQKLAEVISRSVDIHLGVMVEKDVVQDIREKKEKRKNRKNEEKSVPNSTAPIAPTLPVTPTPEERLQTSCKKLSKALLTEFPKEYKKKRKVIGATELQGAKLQQRGENYLNKVQQQRRKQPTIQNPPVDNRFLGGLRSRFGSKPPVEDIEKAMGSESTRTSIDDEEHERRRPKSPNEISRDIKKLLGDDVTQVEMALKRIGNIKDPTYKEVGNGAPLAGCRPLGEYGSGENARVLLLEPVSKVIYCLTQEQAGHLPQPQENGTYPSGTTVGNAPKRKTSRSSGISGV